MADQQTNKKTDLQWNRLQQLSSPQRQARKKKTKQSSPNYISSYIECSQNIISVCRKVAKENLIVGRSTETSLKLSRQSFSAFIFLIGSPLNLIGEAVRLINPRLIDVKQPVNPS